MLAEGLGKGEHEVILQKRTEGEQGRFTAHSFITEGEILQAKGRKERLSTPKRNRNGRHRWVV